MTNRKCPVCGGFLVWTGFGYVCERCGHKPY
jgi:endogenous inhibitor of DNA gyrase (YacG/DUF329 family)